MEQDGSLSSRVPGGASPFPPGQDGDPESKAQTETCTGEIKDNGL